jgi:hypothetical protein
MSENPWLVQGEFSTRNRRPRPKRAYTERELMVLLAVNPRSMVGELAGRFLYDLLRLGLMTSALSAVI